MDPETLDMLTPLIAFDVAVVAATPEVKPIESPVADDTTVKVWLKLTLSVNPASNAREALLATVSPTPTVAVVSWNEIVPPLPRVKVIPTELVAARTPVWLVNPFTVAMNVELAAALPVLSEIVMPFKVNVCAAAAVVSAIKPVSVTTV